MPVRFCGVLPFLALLLALPSLCEGAEYRFFHENVLGTSMELRIIADDRESAEQGELRLLVEIDRLNAIYSEYEPTSEFSQLIQTAIGQTRPISSELAGTLKMCQQWKNASHGAFDPAPTRSRQRCPRSRRQDFGRAPRYENH